jgi:hypothetical protein
MPSAAKAGSVSIDCVRPKGRTLQKLDFFRNLLSGTDSRRLTATQAEGNPNHSSSRKGHYDQDLGRVVVLR